MTWTICYCLWDHNGQWEASYNENSWDPLKDQEKRSTWFEVGVLGVFLNNGLITNEDTSSLTMLGWHCSLWQRHSSETWPILYPIDNSCNT